MDMNFYSSLLKKSFRTSLWSVPSCRVSSSAFVSPPTSCRCDKWSESCQQNSDKIGERKTSMNFQTRFKCSYFDFVQLIFRTFKVHFLSLWTLNSSFKSSKLGTQYCVVSAVFVNYLKWLRSINKLNKICSYWKYNICLFVRNRR
jgi:hypothetical protein